MDARSTRYRSLDAKGAAPPPKSRERHNSVPNGDRQKSQHPRRQSATTKPRELPDQGQRTSKISPRDDPSITFPDRKSSATRQSDGQHVSSQPHDIKPNTKTRDSESIPINVLIIGAPGCGKTSFIQNSVDRESFFSAPGPGRSARVKLTDQYYNVCFIELEIDDVDFSSEQRILWPPHIMGTTFPDIDAVFCLYDASDKDSVADVPTALTSMTNTGVRCMLLASKCDKQDSDQISARFHEQVRRNLANVAIAEISTKTPDNTKRHFLAMLHRVISSPRVTSQSKSTKATSHSTSTHRMLSRETSPKKSRSRSRSKTRLHVSKSKELLLNLSGRPAVIESADEDSETSSAQDEAPVKSRTKLRLDTSRASEGHTRPTGPHTPISSEDQTSGLASPMGTSTLVPETPDSYYVKAMLRPVSTETAETRVYQTFLNMDEETEHSPGKEAELLMPTLTNLKVDESPKQEMGVPFKELIDKLLVLPASKSDSKFVPSFLCLYRAFATPYKLLSAVVDQFVTIDKTKMVHFTKVAEMLRYLQVLAQWTATYPGDFANGPARDLALTFIQSIENSKVFAPAAREISNNLDTLIADEDFDWAFDDSPTTSRGKGSSSNHKKTPTTSSTSLRSSSNENVARQGRKTNYKHDDSDDEGDGGNSSSRGSGVHSNASSIVKNYNASSQSYSNLMQLENAKLQAERLKPNPHIRLSKFQWHHFMETPIDDLAREITRVDWTMYSSIRPRDFVRHVCLTTEQRRNSRRVDNISMMVKHFNHLALFVSGMILLRDKPKHRARALEKFMALAWKVRQLNNYNSLGAIVAGINGHEISRLNSTREMVPHEVQRQFLRLTILMGISRSHAAYRMAWDNSFTERIPFLPLVRQDLTMAASANQTFIGSNINWRKFEIMGDVIVGIQKSLEQPYSFGQRTSRTEDITRLILETKIVEESEDSADPRSELYDRSVQVEQTGADPRKKFDWLRR